MSVAWLRHGLVGRTAVARGRSLPLQWPGGRGLAFDVAAVAFALVCAWFVVREPMGSGDYGQWLMTSRYVSGDETPAYRSFTGVPPLVPTLIAGARAVISDPVVALDVVRVTLLGGLAIAFYVTGTAISGKRLVGLLAMVIAFAFVDELQLLFAFGGLPQAAALICSLLCVASTAMAAARSRAEPLWWALAALAWSLGIVSHVGTLVAFTPALAVLVIAEAAVSPRRPVRAWVEAVAPAVLVAIPALVYWLAVLVPANRVYGENPASLGYRGPGKLWTDLVDDPLTVAAMAAGAVSIVAGTLLVRDQRTQRAFLICSVLLSALVLVISIDAMFNVATDYPRFGPLVLVPLVFALALGLYHAAERAPRLSLPGRDQAVAATLLLAVVMLVVSPWRLGAYAGEAAGYQLHDRDGLFAAASWINDNVPGDGAVLASGAREGKWIEGLTGHEALFFAEVRFSFRPDHWDRSAAADALIRSTASLVNGYLFARLPAAAPASEGVVPGGLSLAVNHRGEYVDVLNLPSVGAAVMGEQGVIATLEALQAVSVEQEVDGDVALLRTTWTGVRNGQELTYTRTIWMDDGSPVLNVVDEVTTAAAVTGMTLRLGPRTDTPLVDSVMGDSSGLLTFATVGRDQPKISVHVSGGGAALLNTPEGIQVHVPGQRVHLQIVAQTAGAPIASLALLDPVALLDTYNVQAVVLRRDPAFDERLQRMALLGFSTRFEVDGYAVLVREQPAADDPGRRARQPAGEVLP